MRKSKVGSLVSLGALAFAMSSACTPGNTAGTGGGVEGGGSAQGGTDAMSTGGNGNGGEPSTSQFMSGAGGGSQTGCDAEPDEDKDGDGFTITAGDCNDCDANSNPGALEVIPEDTTGEGGAGGAGEYVPADEDCDGTPDNLAPPSCDTGIALDSSLPLDAARAIELCKQAATDTDWGIVSAQYVRANGTPTSSNLQNGIMPSFGPNVTPRGGDSLFVISSGRGRIPGQPSACGSATCNGSGAGTPPSAAYPQNAPNCPIGTQINDDVALEATIRAPTNATGYQFDFKFYSFEYPDYICNLFNDQFFALVNPAPMGAMDGNVSFDSNGAPVSVNVAFFTVCAGCADGELEMQGTGFDSWRGSFDDGEAGGTAWLRTQAPVTGGETFSIRFGIFDTQDSALDSTAVVDNFKWIANGGTVNIGTTPTPPE